MAARQAGQEAGLQTGVEQRMGAALESPLEGLPVDDPARGLAEGVLGSAEEEVRSSELSVEDEAARVLEDYRQRGDCVVAQAGYLDLVGRTWGCVTQGEGWAELCLVSEGPDAASEVFVWHLDASEVGAEL